MASQKDNNWADLQDLIRKGAHDGICENCDASILKDEYIRTSFGHFCSNECSDECTYDDFDQEYEAKQMGLTGL